MLPDCTPDRIGTANSVLISTGVCGLLFAHAGWPFAIGLGIGLPITVALCEAGDRWLMPRLRRRWPHIIKPG